jgi:hypothetical protein
VESIPYKRLLNDEKDLNEKGNWQEGYSVYFLSTALLGQAFGSESLAKA